MRLASKSLPTGLVTLLLISTLTGLSGAGPAEARASKRKKPTASAPKGATTTPPAKTPAAPAATTACASKPIKVMPLGDSLTGFPDSYRGPLFRTLKAKGFNVDFVGSISQPPTGGGDPDSNGWGGYRIGPDTIKDFAGAPADLADHVDEWFKANPPDVVLLMIGTNDLAAGGDVTKAAPGKLKALIARVHALAPAADLLVGDVPPYAAQFDGGPDQNAINGVAEAASTPDGLIEHVAIFKRLHDTINKATDYVDGIHFTPSGGEKLANAWLPELLPVLSRRACH